MDEYKIKKAVKDALIVIASAIFIFIILTLIVAVITCNEELPPMVTFGIGVVIGGVITWALTSYFIGFAERY